MSTDPLNTEKIILIDYDDDDALLFFKEEEPDLTDYQFSHTSTEPSGERIDIYYLKENFEKIKLCMKEKYNIKS
jgi:hypothetical protein